MFVDFWGHFRRYGRDRALCLSDALQLLSCGAEMMFKVDRHDVRSNSMVNFTYARWQAVVSENEPR